MRLFITFLSFFLWQSAMLAANAPIYLNEQGQPQGAQGVIIVDSSGAFAGAGLDATTFTNLIGPTNDAAAASDTATATINARLQRIAQRVTSLIALFPTALGPSGGLKSEPQATTSGGATPYSLIAAASTNSTLISTGAHQIYGVQVFNNSSTIAYLKIFDKAIAPTCNSDTPIKRIMIPANAGGSGALPATAIGVAVTLGLGFCVTGGIADNDNTAVAATTYLVNIDYK